MARKILLADDSVTAQNMGRKILTDAGYEVIAVNNGSAALKKIVEQKPDLIVLDVYMPGYSGLEVCQRVKENRETARIPILLTVGKLEPFKPEEARRARADAFVVKPFEASELISAVTKLEEKIGPQAETYKPGRFAKAVAALDETEASAEKFGDSDGGWKSRIRFPGKKKKEAPGSDAPEAAAPAKPFRDFRDEPVPASSKSSSPSEFERPMPAGIPRDITPEEIAAITAAAAQLNGQAPAQSEAKAESKSEAQSDVHQATPVPENAAPATEISPVPELPVDPPEPHFDHESAPVTFASSPEIIAPEISQEKLPEISPGTKDASEIVAAAETHAALAAPNSPIAAVPTEISAPALADAIPSEPVNVAEPAAASVDTPAIEAPAISSSEYQAPASSAGQPQSSDPAAAATLEPVSQAGVTVESPQSEISASLSPEAVAEAFAPQPDTSSTSIGNADEPPAEPRAESPVAATEASPVSEVMSTPVPPAAPQDEEVMAALQNLIPAAGADNGNGLAHSNGDHTAAVPSDSSPSRLGRPRWIAEETALTAEEAAQSLEQEMEKAYAAFAASEAARMLSTPAFDGFDAASASTVVAGVPAAVSEPHHAASFATAVGAADAVFGSSDRGPGAESARFQEIAAAAAALGVSSASVSPEPVVATGQVDPSPAEGSVAHTSVSAEEPQGLPESSPAGGSEAAAAPDSTAASSSQDESSAIASHTSDLISSSSTEAVTSDAPVYSAPAELVSAPAEVALETTDAGGFDSMGKNEGLGFKMIRQSPAGTKAAGAAPVSKENFESKTSDDAKNAEPAVMAAAASAESAPAPVPTPAGAPDPRAIASIVDSVLAELRPKIVEEIAKKLSDPNK